MEKESTFKIMNKLSTLPHTRFANTVFNTTNECNIRFGTKSSWATKTLNSSLKYWIRIRIVSAITTSPSIEYLKIHTNSVLTDTDGMTEYFGDTKPNCQRRIVFSKGTTGDQNIDVSANVRYFGKDN